MHNNSRDGRYTHIATHTFPYSLTHLQAQMCPETYTFIKIYVNTQVRVLLEVNQIKLSTSELLQDSTV